MNDKLFWNEYWDNRFNDVKYLQKLLLRQKKVLDLTEHRLKNIQIEIEKKNPLKEDFLNEIRQVCSDCVHYYELVSKHTIPSKFEQ